MSSLTRWLGPAAAALSLALASPVAAEAAQLTNGAEVHRGPVLMRVTALTDDILRVRIARDGTLPEDASWAVPAAVRAESVPVTQTADGFATKALKVAISPDLKLTVTDLDGRTIVADAAQPDLDGRAFTLSKQLPAGEHVYGLGDKTGGTLDRRGSSYVDWNTDAYGFTSATDPIYKSIPFFIGTGGAGGSYGILLDNTWRAWFDFGHKQADVTTFGAPDGPIDYYIIAGPTTREVVRRYTDLTGKTPLAPMWALGYQQSRYSYMTAGEVRTIAATLRRDRIPTDVIWLDIDFQDRNRPFTIDTKAFPDMKGLVGDLSDEGLKLVAITDLHVADAPDQGYAPYDTGIAGDHFVHRPDGSVYVGKVWPGPSVFPDFTDAGARKWWGTNFKAFVDDGIAGFWNDMNEPSVFDGPGGTMPLDTVHRIASDDFAARTASHAEVHNVYGMENTRATFDGVRALNPDERPFVMTRASYAGGQRYAVTWTGDNSSTWDHLKLSVHQLINLGLSGFSYAGADVGGFTGGPSPELLTRWFEIAAFTPIFRDHAAKGTPRAEPWVDGPEQLAIRRRFVEERYRLMPYLYALADQNARTGDPIMRPVFYDYPALAGATCDQSMAFTLGRDLLVAPPPKPESPESYDVCLPAGGWYDLWTGKAVTAAEGSAIDMLRETPRLDRLPVFVRAGAIVPTQPLVQSTAETPSGPLSLDVYPGADCRGALYLDDGHSMAFAKGHYLRQAIRCSRDSSGGLRIRFEPREGDYRPWWRTLSITVHGWSQPGRVTADGKVVAATLDASAATLRFDIPDTNGGTVTIAARR
ncbi:MAG TPA: TIM-barrel domain-containing protein [Sphingomonas sp.]|nr:TIM-barrel domain-containing protein [Sphingomonas sp.]